MAALAGELIATGLATPNRYNHLTLNPALCPYLRARLESTERAALTARWVEAMAAYVRVISCSSGARTLRCATTLTVLELPNLFALLDRVQAAGDAEATIDLATSLYSLLQGLGKPRLLARVGQVRDAAAAAAGRRLESRAVRGGTDPHRAAAWRRAVARGVRGRAGAAPARPGGG